MKRKRKEMQMEIDMLRRELRVSREAAEITSDLVVKQFEQTEEMLHRVQAAHAERQAVLDGATQLSIIATDLEGTIQLFSEGASTLLGYSAAEMIGKKNILSLHLAEDLEYYGKEMFGMEDFDIRNIKIFDQFIKQKSSQAREWFYICKDGKHLPVGLSITSLLDPSGSFVGYLFSAMDMTLQKKMEHELIKSRVVAEAANASKGDFLARMSHEIRTPMNGIIGLTTLLEKTPLDFKQMEYVDKILFSANTLLSLINDILDFSKIDAGKLHLEQVRFNLEEVLNNVTNVVGLQAAKKNLEFLLQIESNVTYDLIGDPLRLGQILMNLANNAVKFTERGEIVLVVESVEKRKEESKLQFSVRDTGTGLQSDQASKLFAAFSQADDSVTRRYGGTGLGLAICKQLTEMMGGRIWVESELGKGSVFSFTARFKIPATAEETSPLSPELLEGLRILVVDDNESARDILASILRSLKIVVDMAEDGEAALNRLDEAMESGVPYDAVLLDWIMPGIDGIETAKRIKAKTRYAETPAIMMVTAHGREEAYMEAESIGLDGFLLKPVYASVMYDTLLDVLGVEKIAGPKQIRKRKEVINLDAIRGAKILLVEDNIINQRVAGEFLKLAGMDVTIAANGKECLEVLQHHSFDLVFMDIQMPEMDGLEATRRIRQIPEFQNLPIIAMTAHAMSGDREKSIAAGMDEHITKPIDREELHLTLLRWISDKGVDTAAACEETKSQDGIPEKESDLPDLPDMPGIDQEAALKVLNGNFQLFEEMLNDFREKYGSLVTRLREFSGQHDWNSIQDSAHTIKGVGGYIGARSLVESAASLEDSLKAGKREEAADLLIDFIDQLNLVLSSLSLLPVSDVEETAAKGLDKDEKGPDINLVQKPLEKLIDYLNKGELAAEEQFAGIKEIFAGSMLEDQVRSIAGLIDDIEYEQAAQLAQELLTSVRGKSGN